MPQAPALIGNLVASALGRPARVLDLREPAPGFLELELHAAPPPGGWQPGHEIQFRVTPTQGRRYTARTVNGQDPEHICILAATAAGPGTAWIRGLHAGDRLTVLAGRHRPPRQSGTRRLYLGGSCALGTLDAYARSGETPTVAVEVPASAVETLAGHWPRYHFLPAARTPGDALQSWLERGIGNGKLEDRDGALPLGHAQSIQRQRRALIDSRTLERRTITTRPYWADGKEGL